MKHIQHIYLKFLSSLVLPRMIFRERATDDQNYVPGPEKNDSDFFDRAGDLVREINDGISQASSAAKEAASKALEVTEVLPNDRSILLAAKAKEYFVKYLYTKRLEELYDNLQRRGMGRRPVLVKYFLKNNLGIFCKDIKEAVRTFQILLGANPNGKCDNSTMTLLDLEIAKRKDDEEKVGREGDVEWDKLDSMWQDLSLIKHNANGLHETALDFVAQLKGSTDRGNFLERASSMANRILALKKNIADPFEESDLNDEERIQIVKQLNVALTAATGELSDLVEEWKWEKGKRDNESSEVPPQKPNENESENPIGVVIQNVSKGLTAAEGMVNAATLEGMNDVNLYNTLMSPGRLKATREVIYSLGEKAGVEALERLFKRAKIKSYERGKEGSSSVVFSLCVDLADRGWGQAFELAEKTLSENGELIKACLNPESPSCFALMKNYFENIPYDQNDNIVVLFIYMGDKGFKYLEELIKGDRLSTERKKILVSALANADSRFIPKEKKKSMLAKLGYQLKENVEGGIKPKNKMRLIAEGGLNTDQGQRNLSV